MPKQEYEPNELNKGGNTVTNVVLGEKAPPVSENVCGGRGRVRFENTLWWPGAPVPAGQPQGPGGTQCTSRATVWAPMVLEV